MQTVMAGRIRRGKASIKVAEGSIAELAGSHCSLIAKMAMSYFAKLAAATPPPPQEALLTEIRDLLKAK